MVRLNFAHRARLTAPAASPSKFQSVPEKNQERKEEQAEG
jgi:hypothetical protein